MRSPKPDPDAVFGELARISISGRRSEREAKVGKMRERYLGRSQSWFIPGGGKPEM